MAKAVFKDTVLAESDTYEEVEGNVYFPPSAVNMAFFTETAHSTHCPWKGDASYYTISVEGETAENAAWFYKTPKDAAAAIKDHVAFYPVVKVTK